MPLIDPTPLYRSIVGADRLIDLIDAATRADASSGGYPPFNIVDAGDAAYRIELAVAGFTEADLNVEVREGVLSVSGKKGSSDAEGPRYLHQGVAQRSFERRFRLADHVVVDGARLENGMLIVELRRELPEAMKPRTIEINAVGGPRLVSKSSDAA